MIKSFSVKIIAPFMAAAMMVGSVSCEKAGDYLSGMVEKDHEPEEHQGHEDHGGHDEGKAARVEGGGHGEEVVLLTREQIKRFGIEVSIAGPGKIEKHVSLPGEIRVNADRLAHVVPRVAGVVRKVRKSLGDRVETGEVMAVIESRELSDANAACLAAREKLALAEANYAREEGLWKKKVTSEQDYLNAKQALAEARIELRSAERKLRALGFSEEYTQRLPSLPERSLTRYEITAPFGGVVIHKHVAVGEAVKSDADIFVVADLSRVWVDLSVYQRDLPYVREGAKVVISAGAGVPDREGIISYVGPVVGEKTRTALARVVLPNEDGDLRPGLFISGKIAASEADVPVLVPKTALQTFEGKTVVFVETPEGFEPRPVVMGREDKKNVEIESGLAAGERYAAKGSFTIKAQLSKGGFESGHHH
ncbi:MAG: efflux RND transporter periplasmic adaptor subunit [Candidatus Nitrospinota bacterium M3_3B_026]